jgi:hypothetical protein
LIAPLGCAALALRGGAVRRERAAALRVRRCNAVPHWQERLFCAARAVDCATDDSITSNNASKINELKVGLFIVLHLWLGLHFEMV